MGQQRRAAVPSDPFLPLRTSPFPDNPPEFHHGGAARAPRTRNGPNPATRLRGFLLMSTPSGRGTNTEPPRELSGEPMLSSGVGEGGAADLPFPERGWRNSTKLWDRTRTPRPRGPPIPPPPRRTVPARPERRVPAEGFRSPVAQLTGLLSSYREASARGPRSPGPTNPHRREI